METMKGRVSDRHPPLVWLCTGIYLPPRPVLPEASPPWPEPEPLPELPLPEPPLLEPPLPLSELPLPLPFGPEPLLAPGDGDPCA